MGVLATTGLLLHSGAPSAAIENLKVVRGVLILEGKIQAGDYVSVRSFLSETSNFEKMNGKVFLASQGGNADEALKIGYLIRHLRLSTDAPSHPPPSGGSSVVLPIDLANSRNYQCASACFLLYVAGIYRNFIWAGRLGIHQPQVEIKPIGTAENDISMAADNLRKRIKLYLEEMNVPSRYFDLMYSVSPSEVYWLTQSELNSDLEGYVPEVRALLEARCNLAGQKRPDEIDRCVAQANAELRSEAWSKIFRPRSD